MKSLKSFLTPTNLLIAGMFFIFASGIVWQAVFSEKASAEVKAHVDVPSSKPAPVATVTSAPISVQTPTPETVVVDSIPKKPSLQYTARHPPFNMSEVDFAEENVQESPAKVDYPSPVPFRFEPHPELAVSGTGYGLPSSEFTNEVFAKF